MERLRTFWSHSNPRSWLQNVAFLTAGSLLLALNLNLFLAPAQIAPGGVSGTAIIINHFTGWPIGLTITILFCTVNRPHERALRAVATETDSEAFVVTGHGH